MTADTIPAGMALGTGKRVGPYEIIGPLGSGGMGEVFRARDTRLGRDVAIKILPTLWATDPDRLRRFEQEARAAAALNHPNILVVHDVGAEAGVSFVVSELLDGQTLRQILERGPLPTRKTVDYGIQLATGLAAAHEKGIVHRDLKPENVFVTRDGHVKLLDFGLAAVASPVALANRETFPGATLPGTVLGTIGYMAPEQVRGEAADSRSDIFAFGVLLYEMLTGRQPFTGPSPVEALNATLQREPPALDAATDVPPALQRVVERCLEKRPENRFQSAGDLRFALQQISTTSSVRAAEPERARSGRRKLLVGAGWTGVAIAAAVTAFVWGRLNGTRQSTGAALAFHRLTFRPGNILSARFSPDGNSVVYSASWEGRPTEIFTVRLDGGGSRSLEIQDADVAAVSASGELAIIRSPQHVPRSLGTLARLPLGGGAPRDVLEEVFSADFGPGPDDLVVVRRAPDGLQRLERPIGHVLLVSSHIRWPRVSPDGRRIAAMTDTGLVILDAASGRTILQRDWGPSSVVHSTAWDSSSQEVYIVAGRTDAEQAVRAVSLDGHERIIVSAGGSNLLLHDVSRTGRLLIERATSRRGIMSGTLGGATERDLSWLDGSQVRVLSADGQWVLFAETLQGASERGDVYLRRTDGSPPVRLGDGNPLDLSPDNRWALSVTRDKPQKLVLLPTGAGTPRTLDTGGHEPNGGVFSPDGTHVVFGSVAGGGIRFYRLDLESGTVAPLQVGGATPDSAFVLDRSVAIASSGRGVARVLPDGRVEVLDGQTRRIVPGAALPPGDDLAAWASDGQLYVARTSTLPGELYRIDSTTGVHQILRALMPADRAGITDLGPVVVSRNGTSYAYTYRRVTSSDLFVVDR